MQVCINEKQYRYETDVKRSEPVRRAFTELARQTFGLNFEPWYQSGYWTDNYMPHVLTDGNRAAANVSVNIFRTRWQGENKLYIQLGTVMTGKEYRNRGLARWLMEAVLAEWRDRCGALFLFANDGVLGFYPRFGFVPTCEYQYTLPFEGRGPDARKLDMNNSEDVKLLLNAYGTGNRFSAFPMTDNPGLLMFHCSLFMKDNIYYSGRSKAVIIADIAGDTLNCHDIYGGSSESMEGILSSVAGKNTKQVRFGFTPAHRDSMKISVLKEEDATLFMLTSKGNLFAENKLMFPVLSRA